MISILLIGINHFDPLGPMKVRNALQVAKDKGFIPDSIAVEWGRSNAEAIIAQRAAFGEMIANCFPAMKADDVATIEQSLAYEADAHLGIYPNLPIIWLDDGRIASSSIIEKYAIDRAAIIKSAAEKNGIELAQISYQVIRNADKAIEPDDRDNQFASAIETAVASAYHNIACVVGKNHTDLAVKGMFGYQLMRKGYHIIRYVVTADYLAWEESSYLTT